jgi:dTDP-4-dehydrorhamnose reductase
MTMLLITGGSGYLGSALVHLAATQGWQVAATYHSQRPSDSPAELFPLDLRDRVATADLISSMRPTVLIHTAYVQSGPDLWPITAEGAAVVAQAAYAVGTRLLHLSSDVVFDGERTGAYTEYDPPAPISEYGSAKATAEQLVAAAHPAALIIRTSLIYGGTTPSMHEQLVFNAIDRQAEIAFYSDEYRCPIQVGDLAQALLEVAITPQSGILHLAGAETLSRYAFARHIAAASGRDPDLLKHAPSPGLAGRRPRNCALDTTLARSLLRTRLRGVREVLQSAMI